MPRCLLRLTGLSGTNVKYLNKVLDIKKKLVGSFFFFSPKLQPTPFSHRQWWELALLRESLRTTCWVQRHRRGCAGNGTHQSTGRRRREKYLHELSQGVGKPF